MALRTVLIIGIHDTLASSQHTKTVSSNGDGATICRVAAAEQFKQTIHLAADCVRNLLNTQTNACPMSFPRQAG